jgi:hypothetical protein
MSLDAYAIALLRAETVVSADARETRRFLEQAYHTLGAYLPDAVCDVIVKHPDALVRAWAASHIDLVRKDYSEVGHSTYASYMEANAKAPITRDYRILLQGDSDPFVRASLLSNPEDGERLFGCGGTTQNWKHGLAALSQIERLAMVKSPDLNVDLILAIMKKSPSELNMEESEYTEIVSVAVLNPNLIERSRRQGRSWYLTCGDGNPPMEEFAEMWELAATTWLKKNPVPYRIFSFIQTKASVKLDIYRRLGGKENEIFREAIVSGCEPCEDRELLKLSLNDERDSIKDAAYERCGDYLSYVRKCRVKTSSAATKRIGKKSEKAKTDKVIG